MFSTPFDPTPDEPDHKAPVRRLIESLDDLAAVAAPVSEDEMDALIEEALHFIRDQHP